MRPVWFLCGALCVLIGVIGIVVPGLPTVPLLLLAAFFFARSSDSAHKWLLNHPRLGPPIADWNRSGAIRRSAKFAASACIIASLLISIVIGIPFWALSLQCIALCCVTLFIWTRPNV